MTPQVAGFDIGGTHSRCVRWFGGQFSQETIEPTPQNYPAFIDDIESRVRSLTGVERIGVTLPGWVVGPEAKWIPNLPFLNGRRFAEDLHDRIGIPVTLINDAQAALLGETWMGAAKGEADVVLVSLGTGIGGAVMMNGKLFTGNRGCAGSFGWLPASGYQEPRDPNHGELEWTASGKVLQFEAAALGWTSADLFTHGQSGDARALTIINSYAWQVGLGLAAIASILDPAVILISGGLSRHLNLFQEQFRQAQQTHASPAGQQVRVLKAALGDRAGLIGATKVVLDATWESYDDRRP